VVEFGRSFAGELGFLEAPEWRMDLRWIAERAEEALGEMRERARRGKGNTGRYVEGEGYEKGVVVRCVILTKGGEQA